MSLCGAYRSGAGLSAATRGYERELFISSFLEKVFPPGYRFGTGDAIDIRGARSGQLDIVVEFTFLPSVPVPGGSARLYLAEGVAAVVEVKSDLAKQWGEVESTAAALRSLERQFQVPGLTPCGPPPTRIPLFAVGYTGWRQLDTVREKASAGVVDGILVIEPGLFSTRPDFPNGLYAEGPIALWGLISALHYCTLSVVINSLSPIEYVRRHASVTAQDTT
jgi:hypothetical protein